jgi:hypothetical protein
MPTTLYKSALRYIAFSVQSALGTPAVTPTLFIPIVTSQSKFKWAANVTDEKYNTGDLFMLVDGIPTKPVANGTIVFPWKPAVLNPLLAACCYANGDILPPVWCTFFVGNGFKEAIYSDVLCSVAKMSVSDDDAPALWTATLMGLNKPVPHAPRTILLPTYERSLRMVNLIPATVLGATGINGWESITWTLDAGVTAYYGSKGDGTDGPSFIVNNELNATMEGTLAHINDAINDAYINTCGAPGLCVQEFDSTCGTAHTHALTLPNGLVYDDEVDAPDNLVINETITIKGLRAPDPSVTGAVATIAIT